MPKGYWIAHVTVTDPEGYKQYIAANGIAFAKHDAKLVVRAGRYEAIEGGKGNRHVVIEFPSYEDAVACYNSPEYQAARAKRAGAGIAEIVIVEGVG